MASLDHNRMFVRSNPLASQRLPAGKPSYQSRRFGPVVAALALALGMLSGCGAAKPAATPTTSGGQAVSPAPTNAALTSVVTSSPTSTPTHSASSISTQTYSPVSLGVITSGSLPAELIGTFTVSINLDEVTHADEAGDWFLILTRDTGYEFGRLATGTVENYGDLTIDGDQLTFSNEQGAGACVGPGAYTWRVSGDKLTLSMVEDACGVRVVQTSAHTYVRCPNGVGSCREVLDVSR